MNAEPVPAASLGAEISITHLSKHFGTVKAIDDLSFEVPPGEVCGFLGPNGAGKTTTLRCLLGLVAANSGTATIGGVRYADLADPLATVGAMLDAGSFHPGRRARDHLRVLCAASGIPDARADEVLTLTGLTDVGRRRVGTFSTGMRQRLGLAAALLGDPNVLVLDEPATGLDPAGISWLRELLQYLAHERGKTVLVSSHLLSEVQQTVDRVVIIASGRLVHEGPLEALIARAGHVVRVRTPQVTELARTLTDAGMHAERVDGQLVVQGADAAHVGHLAFAHGIELHELGEEHTDLEQVFLTLTGSEPAGGAV